MRTNDYHWSQVRVGLFVAICGTILFGAVFYFGISGTSLAHYVHVRADFDNIFGLAEGSPVELGGVLVGSIEGIGLPDLGTGKVPVTLSIEKEALDRLGGSSVAYASSHAIVGQRFIGLTPRRPDEPPLRPGATINTRKSPALDTLEEQAADTLNQVNQLVHEARAISGTVLRVTSNIEAGHGTLGHLLRDDALYDSLSATAQNTQLFTQQIAHGHGALAVLANDLKLAGDVKDGVGALADTARGIRAGRGVIGRLTNDETNAHRVDQALADVDVVANRLVEARGTLGTLISDRGVLERINGLLGQMDSLVADVRRNPQRYLKLKAF